MHASKYISFLLILLLASCAAPPPKPVATTTTPVVSTPTQKTWQASGRIAAKQSEKGANASFVWQQKGESYLVRLFGPFGSGGVVIKNYPQYVELKEANGKITTANTPEMLMQKIAHWQVPITGLQYWLRGAPSPHGQVTSQKLDDKGRLAFLSQQGWKIHYENYFEDNLPNKLRLENGNIKIKMIVTAWKTP